MSPSPARKFAAPHFREHVFLLVARLFAGSALWLALTYLLGTTAGAQSLPNIPNLESGFKQFGPFLDSDVDSVNLVNGKLELHIPLVSYPQRGGKLQASFYLRYNNPVYSIRTIVPLCPTGPPCPPNQFTWMEAPIPGVYVASDPFDTESIQATQPDTRGLPLVYTLSIVTPDGSRHEMGLTSGNPNGTLSLTGTTWEAVDGSGFHIDGNAQVIVYPNGTRMTLEPCCVPNTAGTIKDTNGNEMSFTAPPSISASTLTDTLGRIIPAPPNTNVSSNGTTIVNGVTTSDYTGCTGPLPVAAARLWSPPSVGGGQMQFKFCYASVSVQSSLSGPSNPTQINATFELLQSLVLPNGTAWTFQYDNGGLANLTQITRPTGGTISYAWNTPRPLCDNSLSELPTWNAVLSTRSVNANDGTGSHVWQYQLSSQSTTIWTMTVNDPLGNSSVHTLTGLNGSCSLYETLTQQYQAGSLLSTVQTDYANSGPDPNDFYGQSVVGAHPIRVTTTWPNGAMNVKKIEVDPDPGFGFHGIYNYALNGLSGATLNVPYGKTIAQREYDYGTNSPGPLLRQTLTAYMFANNSNYLANNLLDLESSVTTLDGAGTQRAQTTYSYDQSPSPSCVCGNQTSVATWLNTTGGFLSSTRVYNPTGTISSSKDADGNQTTYAYSSTYLGAYLTATTNALSQTTSYAYDFNTGLLTSITDPNSQTTSYTYDGPTWRPLQVTRPDGGQTNFCYTDILGSSCYQPGVFESITTQKASSSQNEVTTKVFDGLGRITQTQLNSDPDGTTLVDTTYDGLGRTYCTSNPYRSTADMTYGITTNVYDALGRPTVLQPPDYWSTTSTGSPTCQSVTPLTTPANPTSYVATGYSGNCTTVTDQAGKARKSCTDGLGRLTKVFEDPAGLNYETDYAYDALNNLLCVAQNNAGTFSGCNSIPASWRPRTFVYDSLSRLTSATNPESGTITYAYDANSNLTSKTSPAPNQTGTATVTLSYCYDALNRLTGKAYTAQTCSNGLLPAPLVSYFYDQASSNGLTITNGIGRRTGMTDQAGSEAWSYDSMGRPLTEKRTANNLSKVFTYAYNLDGSMFSISAPTFADGSHAFINTYIQGGAGRTLSMTNSGSTFVGDAHYTPSGANCYLQNYWDGTWTSTGTFNNRLQPATYQVQQLFSGTQPPVCGIAPIYSGGCCTSILDLGYTFTDASGHNNGDVVTIANNIDMHRTQNFTYDSLNRVATAQTLSTNQPWWQGDPGGLANCWAEQYSYDPWGNLTSIAPSSSSLYTGCTQESALSMSATTKNQLQDLNNDYVYDAAGNLIQPGTSGGTYTFDAENHLVSAGGVNYSYDGDGKRLMKSNGTIYWYGAGSEPVIESDLSNNPINTYYFFNGQRIGRYHNPSATAVEWYFADHLGNARFVWSQYGSDESDYYPFGGERIINSDSGAQNHYKFTGKERDSESGLDNFIARYDSSSLGRFMSPDPGNDSGFENQDDPQSWNAYSYVRNNPLNLTDPDGRDYRVCVDNGNGGQNCTTYANYNDFQKAANASGAALNGDNKNGQILVNGKSVGSYQFFVGPGVEGAGVPEDNTLAPILFGGIFGGLKAGVRGIAEGLFGGGAKTAAEEAAVATVTDAAAGATGGSLTPGTVFNAGRGLLGGEAELSSHAAAQAAARGVTKAEIEDALSMVPKQEAGRGSVVRFIGKAAEVRVNRVTGTIVTVIRFAGAGAASPLR